MAVSGILEISAGTVPGTPNSGLIDLYIDTADLRLKSIDTTPTTRVYVDRDSAETLTNKVLVTVAGTASVAPLTLTTSAGTLMTTSGAGAFEYDGTAGYFSHAASGRGVLPNTSHITLTGAYTLTSQQAAQKLFNAPTNGSVTVAGSTTYYFECEFALTSMSGSSGSFGFALGGTANLTRQAWTALAQKSAALATAATAQITFNTAANVTLATASTTTTGSCRITGKIVVGTGGTVIPQVSLGVAAAAVVSNDAWFRIWPAGSNSVQSVGNWT